MNFFAKLGGLFFGGKSDKGIVEQAADAIERFAPGQVKQAEMAIDALKAGDESQKNAQQLILANHDTWFDVLVDGINRLVRPMFSIWTLGVLAGVVNITHLAAIPPMAWNIIWTVIGFWFGQRVLFSDLPNAINAWRKK
jgi:hypothetical protein